MLGAVIIFLPIVLIYTSWVYHVMRGKISREMIEQDKEHVSY